MPSSTDLVVVLPGIMGSTLLDRHGDMVWGPSVSVAVGALLSRGATIDRLALPDDIGDGEPTDGVVPGELMRDVSVVPGLWTPLRGYTPLIDMLHSLGITESTPAEVGRLLLFPYDWRLSNRRNANRLDAVLTPALERLQALGGQYADAKIRFVCHSMGGLVARAWIAFHGGAARTRRLITLGTPYRGAALALGQLVNGVRRDIGPLHVNLDRFTRSLPAVYELLPTYACIARGGTVLPLETVVGQTALDADRVEDAKAFHTALEAAEASDPGTADRRYLIVGSDQPTATTATVIDGVVTLLNGYPGGELFGDGTVPATAGPAGLDTSLGVWHRFGEHHGNLQRNALVLREVRAAIGGGVTPALMEPRFLSAIVPDLILDSEPLLVQARAEEADRFEVTVTDEQGRPVTRTSSGPAAEIAFPRLHPGVHTAVVRGSAGPLPLEPVTSTVLVWPTVSL